MLLGLYLSLVIALPLALGAIVGYNGLPRTRHCPLCAGDTLRIRSPRHAIMSRLVPGLELHARWCPSCEWSGTTRAVPAPVLAEPPVTAVEPTAPKPAGLEIRRVDLGAESWRVHLECWAEDDAWHGRLMFVGPGGHAWADGRGLLRGRTALQVLTQVLSLSDEALVGRIRKASR